MASLHLYGGWKLPEIVQIFLRLTEYLHTPVPLRLYQWTLAPELKHFPLRRVRVAVHAKAAPWWPCPRGDPHAELDHKNTHGFHITETWFVFVLTTLPDSSSLKGGRPGSATSYWSLSWFSFPFHPFIILECSHLVQKKYLGFISKTFVWSTASPLINYL